MYTVKTVRITPLKACVCHFLTFEEAEREFELRKLHSETLSVTITEHRNLGAWKRFDWVTL